MSFGLERYALGLIPSDQTLDSQLLCDNLGAEWWLVAGQAQGLETRQEFLAFVRTARAPFFVPAWFHAKVNEKLAAADLYYSTAPTLVTPARTQAGMVYLITSGSGNGVLDDMQKIQLGAIATIAIHVWRRIHSFGAADGARQLTTRERQIIQLAALGLTSGQIAGSLAITERTVLAHISSAMNKVDAPTRTAAVAKAMKQGIIDI